MKTLVLFYSYSGHSKKLAEKLGAKESADIEEIQDVKRPNKLKAFTVGCFASMRGKSWPIKAFKADFKKYDHLILFSPIWAGNVPPAVNAMLERLPEGKTVTIRLLSGSGKSNCRERLETSIKSKGGNIDIIEDIKA